MLLRLPQLRQQQEQSDLLDDLKYSFFHFSNKEGQNSAHQG